MNDDPIVEHATMMSGGGMHVRKESEYTRRRWPAEEWITDMQRSGDKVYRRTVIVVEDWTEVPG